MTERTKGWICAAAALACLVAGAALAEESDAKVTTGTRLGESANMPVSVVGRDKIEGSGANTMHELMKVNGSGAQSVRVLRLPTLSLAPVAPRPIVADAAAADSDDAGREPCPLPGARTMQRIAAR